MALPEYSWNPNIQVTPAGSGVYTVSWNHISIANPITNGFGASIGEVCAYPITPAVNPAFFDGIEGTTPEDIPMLPTDSHGSEWPGQTANSIHRWVGLGIFAYEVFFDGVLVGRTHMSSVRGLHETTADLLTGGVDSLGNPRITDHSYAMEPYTMPENSIDITYDLTPETEVTLDALYEELPPYEVDTFVGTSCVHDLYDIVWMGDHYECTRLTFTCQEQVIPAVTQLNDGWPTDYPAGAVNGYLFEGVPDCVGSHAHGLCPCTINTCFISIIGDCEAFGGVLLGHTTRIANHGLRHRIPGVLTIAGPQYVLDGARELIWQSS